MCLFETSVRSLFPLFALPLFIVAIRLQLFWRHLASSYCVFVVRVFVACFIITINVFLLHCEVQTFCSLSLFFCCFPSHFPSVFIWHYCYSFHMIIVAVGIAVAVAVAAVSLQFRWLCFTLLSRIVFSHTRKLRTIRSQILWRIARWSSSLLLLLFSLFLDSFFVSFRFRSCECVRCSKMIRLHIDTQHFQNIFNKAQ